VALQVRIAAELRPRTRRRRQPVAAIAARVPRVELNRAPKRRPIRAVGPIRRTVARAPVPATLRRAAPRLARLLQLAVESQRAARARLLVGLLQPPAGEALGRRPSSPAAVQQRAAPPQTSVAVLAVVASRPLVASRVAAAATARRAELQPAVPQLNSASSLRATPPSRPFPAAIRDSVVIFGTARLAMVRGYAEPTSFVPKSLNAA
jgi:hypothetical protein